MKFPTYWAKGEAEETNAKGHPTEVSCWGWSDISLADAKATAIERAKKLLGRFVRGDDLDKHPYGYDRAPLREEVIQRVDGSDDSLAAAITQNSYGVLVLNTAHVMFVDLDFDYRHVKRPSLMSRLFGNQDVPSPEQQQEAVLKERVANFLSQHQDWGVRMYRTCAGMRLLVTHELFDPKSSQTIDLLKTLGSDPLYIQLCQSQECFRARLTPKPWRCDHYSNPAKWPHRNAEMKELHQQWQREYEQAAEGFATCRFMGSLGSQIVHPDVQVILGLHDHLTQCEKNLPLA